MAHGTEWSALPDDGLGAGLEDLPLRPPLPPVNPSEVDGRCPGERSATGDARAPVANGVGPGFFETSCRPTPSLPLLALCPRSLTVGDGTWLRRAGIPRPPLSPMLPLLPPPLDTMYPLKPGGIPDDCCLLSSPRVLF